jgi:hypothetical protein
MPYSGKGVLYTIRRAGQGDGDEHGNGYRSHQAQLHVHAVFITVLKLGLFASVGAV